jgi:hypothetical protein
MSEPGSQGQLDEAMVDLLVKQVTEGLSPAEQRALGVLDSATLSEHLREFERAAAAASLAAQPEPLPSNVRARLESQAEAFLASSKVVPLVAKAAPAAVRGRNLGWLAAAACLVLAVFGWLRTPPAPPVANLPPPVVLPVEPTPKAPPTPAEEREGMLAKDGALKITLGATKDPAAAGVTGDVVWDPPTQKGYLHIAGLAPNDPQARQYQLWIFDGARDKRYPVDGGVFDVPASGGEVVIPIRAALMVHKPAAFAVTVEKPGGAVVSARDHVIALGAAG